MKPERRRFPRVQELLSAQYRASGDLTSSWLTVTTLNMSAGGVRFRGTEPLQPGALLALRVQVPGVSEMLDLLGQVVWSHMQASGVTESGVEFLDITPHQQALIDQAVTFLGARV